MSSVPGNTPAPPTAIHIFLDLDGVLADFQLHLEQQGKIGPDGAIKWDELDHQWWATIPPCEGAREFYDAAVQMGVVRFLTAPTYDEGCFSGKASWLKNFVPERGPEILDDAIICRDKTCISRPGYILIDDRRKNVEDWRGAGGIGIQHKGDFEDTLRQLRQAIVDLTALPPTPAAPQKPPAGPRP